MTQNTVETTTVLMCGIGGQGTITAADLLAKTATASGLMVKMSEIHGMSQRGGAVTTIVRFGTEVHSMVCDRGQADCILSFEITEALRNIHFLKPGGSLLVNSEAIKPQSVLTGKAMMPPRMEDRLRQYGGKIFPATELARQAGTTKCANVVLLGALASALPFELELWESIIASKVPPKTIDMNIQAFRSGLAAVSD